MYFGFHLLDFMTVKHISTRFLNSSTSLPSLVPNIIFYTINSAAPCNWIPGFNDVGKKEIALEASHTH